MKVSPIRIAELLLALIESMTCLFVTGYVWQFTTSHQSIWSLPVLYLLEVPILCVIGMLVTVYGFPVRAFLHWMIAGAVLALGALAMFSIGLLYLPIAMLLGMLAVLSSLRTRQRAILCVAWAIVAALAQVAILNIGVMLRL